MNILAFFFKIKAKPKNNAIFPFFVMGLFTCKNTRFFVQNKVNYAVKCTQKIRICLLPKSISSLRGIMNACLTGFISISFGATDYKHLPLHNYLEC